MISELTGASWIWHSADYSPDEHAEFFIPFEYSGADRVVLAVSADNDYGVYINGKLIAFGQYPDYPHYKVYDLIDVTEHLQNGKNSLAFELWYLGNNCFTNIDDGAGLCFTLYYEKDGERRLIAKSDESVLSRLSKTYINHACKSITSQIGYGYSYDSTAEDVLCDWRVYGGEDFMASVKVTPDKLMPSIKRPIKTLVNGEAIGGRLIKSDTDGSYRYLFDFGCEIVGVYRIRFNSKVQQHIKLCYGEHIADGWVRDRIHSRDFSFDYYAKRGDNDYFGYFRRLGLRYAEFRSESPLEDIEIEIIPRNYPLATLPFDCKDDELNAIYEICERTLRLCMHEHYEDCPWREQSMYILDSRNQMLCGYYAFGEYEFPRACLELICEDRREDRMLSICYPAGGDMAIPSFALHLYTSVKEYGIHSGDWDFVKKIYPKLRDALSLFVERWERSDDGLAHTFGEAKYWNFYEWADGLDGYIGRLEDERADLIINCLLSVALRNMHFISENIGESSNYLALSERLNANINKAFFNADTGLYGMYSPSGRCSELGNSLALLCGAAQGEIAESIRRVLCDESSDLVKTTLSMKGFKYDALLSGGEAYADHVIADIRRIYRKMLEEGATTVWETEDGERAFDNAGSLCHGWSALPIYYFHKLIK